MPKHSGVRGNPSAAANNPVAEAINNTFGSIAEAVLRQAEIPVFLMRQTKAQVAARAAWETVR